MFNVEDSEIRIAGLLPGEFDDILFFFSFFNFIVDCVAGRNQERSAANSINMEGKSRLLS